MADNYNLVDNMLQDMQRNNSPDVLNYQPSMGGNNQYNQDLPMRMPNQGMSPQVQMGEVDYIPREQQYAPTMQNNMMSNMANEHMIPDDMEDAAMDAPDLANYGMEEEESNNMFDRLFAEGRGPLIVVALAFAMSLPQVNVILRNLLSRLTPNPMYMNIAMAVILGIAFWVINKFLG